MVDDTQIPSAPPLGDDYNLRSVFESTQDDLIDLIRKRELMDWRISKLQNDLVHLAALCGQEVTDPLTQLGMTDAVRWIFAREKKPLNAGDVADILKRSDSEASEYKNLGANIQTIIKRLLKAKEIKPAAVDITADIVTMGLKGIGGLAIGTLGGGKYDRYEWSGGIPPLPPPSGWLKERLKK